MENLVIFDYSGTLSLEAVRFGRPDRLAAALKRSGLGGLGIDAATYWRHIVAPTWETASTAGKGFTSLMVRQIRTRLAPAASDEAVAEAAGRFLQAYLQSGFIDPGWKAVLARVLNHSCTQAVVATDHYLEATGAIIGHLGDLGLPARPLTPAPAAAGQAFIVANSADIGYHKNDPLFWRTLKTRLGKRPPAAIALVEDFGANETDQSGYGARHAVASRERETVAALSGVFDAPVTIVSLAAGPSGIPDIETASRRIENFLAAH